MTTDFEKFLTRVRPSNDGIYRDALIRKISKPTTILFPVVLCTHETVEVDVLQKLCDYYSTDALCTVQDLAETNVFETPCATYAIQKLMQKTQTSLVIGVDTMIINEEKHDHINFIFINGFLPEIEIGTKPKLDQETASTISPPPRLKLKYASNRLANLKFAIGDCDVTNTFSIPADFHEYPFILPNKMMQGYFYAVLTSKVYDSLELVKFKTQFMAVTSDSSSYIDTRNPVVNEVFQTVPRYKLCIQCSNVSADCEPLLQDNSTNTIPLIIDEKSISHCDSKCFIVARIPEQFTVASGKYKVLIRDRYKTSNSQNINLLAHSEVVERKAKKNDKKKKKRKHDSPQ